MAQPGGNTADRRSSAGTRGQPTHTSRRPAPDAAGRQWTAPRFREDSSHIRPCARPGKCGFRIGRKGNPDSACRLPTAARTSSVGHQLPRIHDHTRSPATGPLRQPSPEETSGRATQRSTRPTAGTGFGANSRIQQGSDPTKPTQNHDSATRITTVPHRKQHLAIRAAEAVARPRTAGQDAIAHPRGARREPSARQPVDAHSGVGPTQGPDTANTCAFVRRRANGEHNRCHLASSAARTTAPIGRPSKEPGRRYGRTVITRK
jgi:hypothetical protein